jgi:hypothetical protein
MQFIRQQTKAQNTNQLSHVTTQSELEKLPTLGPSRSLLQSVEFFAFNSTVLLSFLQLFADPFPLFPFYAQCFMNVAIISTAFLLTNTPNTMLSLYEHCAYTDRSILMLNKHYIYPTVTRYGHSSHSLNHNMNEWSPLQRSRAARLPRASRRPEAGVIKPRKRG